jgi:hypothetical protein
MHVPFEVTALLQQGAVVDMRRGVMLDGLLASVLRDQARGSLTGSLLDGGLGVDCPADWDLPLARCMTSRDGEDVWHWMATCGDPVGVRGMPVEAAPPDVHRLMVRLDERRGSQVAVRMPADAGGLRGRFRPRISPVMVTPAAALVWRAVGDMSAVEALLADVWSVGGRRGSGEGAVLGWQVRELEGQDRDRVGHVHADGRLGRPVPVECARRCDARLWGEGVGGIRPPSFHRSRQMLLAVPAPGSDAVPADTCS